MSPKHSINTLPLLMEKAFSKINIKNILNSDSMSKFGNRISEKAWQFELYNSINKCIPYGIYVSPEVGKIYCDSGVVDLYISAYGWAIELLVDGNRLKDHSKRFLPGNFYLIYFLSKPDDILFFNLLSLTTLPTGGKYSDIPINSYVLVDIRQTVNKNINNNNNFYPNTWSVIPSKDLKYFDIIEFILDNEVGGDDDIIEIRRRIFKIFVKNDDKDDDKKYRVYENILEKWLFRLLFVNVSFLIVFVFLFLYK